MADKIKGITIEFRGDTTKLSRAISTVKKESNDLSRDLNAVNRSLKFNPTSVMLWSQKQKILTQNISSTRDKLSLLKKQQANMDAQGVDKASREYMKLEREIIKAENQLKRFERELRKIGSAKLQALGAQFKQIGGKMKAAGNTLTRYITGPLAAIGAVSVKKYAEVDKTMQLTNETMQNSEEDAKLLDKAMKDAASNSTFGMSDAAQASLNFARAGLNAEQAASALAPAMKLAAGEGGNLDTVSAGLVATINGFGDDFGKAGEYADVFTNACNNSALEIDGLSDAMAVAAPTFSAAGYGVKDAALYLGVFADKGIEANEGATALKTGFARLVDPPKAAAAWMDRLGISVTNADGSMKSSAEIQETLHNKFSKLSDSERLAAASAIFGKNQMSKWLALIDTSPDKVAELSGKLDEQGTTTEMAAAMMSGFGGSLEKLKSSIDVAATSFGEALAPTIQKVADVVQKLVDWFNNLSPAAQTMIATVATVAAALGPFLVVLGTIISKVGGAMQGVSKFVGTLRQLKPAVSGATGFAGKLGALFGGISLPVVVAIAAIGALVAAFVYLWKTNAGFRKRVTAIWEQVKKSFSLFYTGIKSRLQGMGITFKSVSAKIKKIWSALSKFLAPAFETAFSAVSVIVDTALKTILGLIDFFIALWKGDWKGMFAALKRIFRAQWDGLKSLAGTLFNGLKKMWDAVLSWFGTSWEKIWTQIKDFAKTIWGGIKDYASFIWDSIKNVIVSPIRMAKEQIESIMKTIERFFPLNIGNVFSNFNLPHISVDGGQPPYGIGGFGYLPSFDVQWYKQGGIFRKPTLLSGGSGIKGVGEAGAEAVLPLDLLWSHMAEMADSIVNGVVSAQAIGAAGAGGNIVIPIYLYPSGPKMGEEIVKLYNTYQRRLHG